MTVVRDPKEFMVSAFFFFPNTIGLRDQVTPEKWPDYCLRPTWNIVWVWHWFGTDVTMSKCGQLADSSL